MVKDGGARKASVAKVNGNGGGQVDANGQPITDYSQKYDMTPDAVSKMKEKFNRKEKDFL